MPTPQPWRWIDPVRLAVETVSRQKARGLGGWIENGTAADRDAAPLHLWIPPADWNVGAHAKHLRNLYVYFWRWATWKVFGDGDPSRIEGRTPDRRGIVSFITVAGFLNGPGFQKMRAELRRAADEIWVIDCSPEGHQPSVPQACRHESSRACSNPSVSSWRFGTRTAVRPHRRASGIAPCRRGIETTSSARSGRSHSTATVGPNALPIPERRSCPGPPEPGLHSRPWTTCSPMTAPASCPAGPGSSLPTAHRWNADGGRCNPKPIPGVRKRCSTRIFIPADRTSSALRPERPAVPIKPAHPPDFGAPHHHRVVISNPSACSGKVSSFSRRVAFSPNDRSGALALTAGLNSHPRL